MTIVDDRGIVSLDAFLVAAESFLRAHAAPVGAISAAWGDGSDVVGFTARSAAEDAAGVAAARQWRRDEFDAGFGWITGPLDRGGAGLPEAYERAYLQLRKRFAIPDLFPVRTGVSIVVPALMASATESVKRRHIVPILRGDEILCQLFSEPDAGSDLANIQTRAERDGDVFVLNGQKVWSSGAHYADLAICVARTATDRGKHAGLSAFVVDMRSPGIEVRPIRQINGAQEFDEVFLTDVAVPVENLVGSLHGGWDIVGHILACERAAIGEERIAVDLYVHRLLGLIEHEGAGTRLEIRQQAARAITSLTLCKWLPQRLAAARPPGHPPGAEMGLAKLATCQALTDVDRVATAVLGMRSITETGAWGTRAWGHFSVGRRGLTIGGGTTEVLRNGIGERVLGLPREPRAAAEGKN